jgi:hypothetical protein
MTKAALNDHLEILKFLHQHRKEGCLDSTPDAVCAKGHLETLRFLLEVRKGKCTVKGFHAALERGHVGVAKYLLKETDFKVDEEALLLATRGWQIQSVELILDIDATSDWTVLSLDSYHKALLVCCEGNMLDIFEILMSRVPKVETPESALITAASHGHLSIFEHLYETRPTPPSETMLATILNYTIERNYIEILQYILEKNPSVSLNEFALGRAAFEGNLAVVCFILNSREEGCLYCAASAVRTRLLPAFDIQNDWTIYLVIFQTIVETMGWRGRLLRKVVKSRDGDFFNRSLIDEDWIGHVDDDRDSRREETVLSTRWKRGLARIVLKSYRKRQHRMCDYCVRSLGKKQV